MLITKLKEREKVANIFSNKNVFIFKCFGCKEVYFPEEEIDALLKELKCFDKVVRLDYFCREEFVESYIDRYRNALEKVDIVVVFSCGVGVQVVSKLIPDIFVFPGCDTYYINGFQGLTSQDIDCQQCGQCWLNITGGICPITSCSKSLLNGPCGGTSKDGKCEVNKNMDCGWILIYKRLNLLNEEKIMKEAPINLRDYRIIIDWRQKRGVINGNIKSSEKTESR